MGNDRPGIPNEQTEPIMDGAMDHETSPSDDRRHPEAAGR